MAKRRKRMLRILEQLDPDTALPGRSIWNGVNRDLLEQQSQELFTKQHVPGRRCYTGIMSTAHADVPHDIPLEVERSLVDDFAFIAASEPQVDSVSAVAMEQDGNEHSLMFRIAANEGVTPLVEEYLDQLLAVLRSYARKEVRRAFCEDRLFDIIVELNCNKILGRLGSKHFQRPRHLFKAREPLSTRLRNLLNALNQPLSIAAREDLIRLQDHILSFEESFEILEAADPGDVIQDTKAVIRQAFHLTENGTKLPQCLAALGCPEAQLDARDVREVIKIANYWRISRHLTKCSRLFCLYFANAAWCAIPSYRASSTSHVLSRQFIHAEIQLLAYYEKAALKLTPRMIGVSKEACFLCDSFIRAHAMFSVSGAHRQMVSQWTVPDLKEYSHHSVSRIRRALLTVCGEVEEEYVQSRSRKPWRPLPLQSAVNLHVIHLVTPSASTLHSSNSISDEYVRASTPALVLSASTEPRVQHNNDMVEEKRTDDVGEGHFTGFQKSTEQDCRSGKDSLDEGSSTSLGKSAGQRGSKDDAGERSSNGVLVSREQDHEDGSKRGADHTLIDVTIHESVSRCTTWMSVIGTRSRSPNTPIPNPQSSELVPKSISVEPVSHGNQHVVRLDDIPLEGEITLTRDADDAQHELSFVLVGPQEQAVQVRCQWHG